MEYENVIKQINHNFVLSDVKISENKDRDKNKLRLRKLYSSSQNINYNYYLTVKRLWKNQKHLKSEKNYKFDLNIGVKIIATITMCPICKQIFTLKEIRQSII
jgi:hypothetical protein